MSRLPDGWRRASLSSIATIQTGLAKGGKPPNNSVELPYLRVANVQDGYLDLSEIRTIQIERQQSGRYLLREGDVLLTEGGDFDKLGRGTVWRGEIPTCLHQNHVFAVRLDREQVLPDFFALQTASPYGRQYFLGCAKRSTNLASINKSQLSEFPVLCPPLPEQRKIACILGTWDAAIGRAEQLIAALQRRKQGLMQRLLTGAVRFSEFVSSDEKQETRYGSIPAEWSHVPLGEIACEVSLRNTNGHDLPVLSCTKYDGLVDSLAYFGRQIFSDDTSDYRVVKRGQFAYATNHIEEGSIGYQNLYDAALISPMYTVFETTGRVNDAFLYRLLKTELYRHIFEVNTSGTVNRRGRLGWEDFARIKVPIPSRAEQRKIAEFFATVDQEIALQKQRLAQLQRQKQGLMQRLLTGQVRVQVPEQ